MVKAFVRKINDAPISTVVFFLLVFFLPFQKRFHKFLRPLSQFSFKGLELPSYFFDTTLDYFLCDFFLLSLLFFGLFTYKRSFSEIFFENSKKYLSLFLFFSLLSIPFSAGISSLWAYYRWFQLALSASLVYFFPRKWDIKKVIEGCFWIIFWVALLQSLFAFAQYILQESIGLKYLGEQTISYLFSPQIRVESQEKWLFDKIIGSKTPSKHILRPFGTLPYPNILGGFLGMGIFTSSYLFLKEKKRWVVGLLCTGILIQILATGLTYSRGAIFGIIGGFFILLFFLWKRSLNWKRFVIPFLLGGILGAGFLHEQYIHRGGVISVTKSSQKSDSARVYYCKIGLELAKQRPLLGHGWGHYLLAAEKVQPPSPPHHMMTVHNIYILLLTEVGGIGLLAFCLFFLSLIYRTWRCGIDLINGTLLTILFYFLWFGMVDHFWIATIQGRLMLFLIAALLFAYGKEKRELQTPTN